MSLLFVLLPAILGGMLLASVVRRYAGRVAQIRVLGFRVGAALGALGAAAVASVGLMTVLSFLEGRPLLTATFVLLATITGAATGGVVGRKLAKPYADGT